MKSERLRTSVPVLGYHSISDERRDGTLRWSVSPSDFDEQMALLAARGRTPLTVSGYAAVLRGAVSLPPRPVLVTFDDGFADLATAALPVLQRHGITATAYVITSRLSAAPSRDSEPTLDMDQLAELRANNVEVGSHGHTHRALDCLSHAEAVREVRLSKLVLEDTLQHQVSSFAYPYGYHTSAVRRHVAAAGYTSACGVKNALSHPADDVFAIARVLVQRDMGTAALEALLDDHGWSLAWRGEHLRTRGWRAYRRARHLVHSARTRERRPVAESPSEVGS
jgi:peptidoglycan/xylan/chitin deacetylase (PgdA/CDA1 family)